MEHQALVTNALSDVVLPVALAVIMFGMGMTLTGADFRRVGRMPLAVGVGVAAQVLLLPVLAMAVAVLFAKAFGWSQALVLGLLVLACSPGGATSNLVAYLARADAALSVTLTSVVSLASAVVTPLTFLATTWILFADPGSLEVSFVSMAALVAGVVVLPIVLGMQVRRARPRWADAAGRPVRWLSVLFLSLVIAGVILANRDRFWELAALSVPAVLLLNVLALGSGLAVARLVRLARPQGRALAIELGFQNGTLGIALAVTQLGSAEAAIVPGFYSLVMFVTGGALAWWWARDARLRSAAEPAPDAA